MQRQVPAGGEDTGLAPPPHAGLDRLGQRDFQRLAAFIHSYSGIKMPASKATMVEGRLRRRVRATGMANLAAYCRYLFDAGGLEVEAVDLIDAVTTNKTEFFREPEHFRRLADDVFAALAALRRPARDPITLWSAACSTGAEPYSIAMVMAELARNLPELKHRILATDICTEVLEAALLGIYAAEMFEPVPAALRTRYVLRSRDSSRGLMRIAPELRRAVQFGRLNLMDGEYPIDGDIDAIFCRNVLIYFDKPTQEGVLRRLCSHLRPGGFLFLGHSETLGGFDLPLRPAGNTIFQRT